MFGKIDLRDQAFQWPGPDKPSVAVKQVIMHVGIFAIVKADIDVVIGWVGVGVDADVVAGCFFNTGNDKMWLVKALCEDQVVSLEGFDHHFAERPLDVHFVASAFTACRGNDKWGNTLCKSPGREKDHSDKDQQVFVFHVFII